MIDDIGKTSAVVFGHGTVEVSFGINENMRNSPYILFREWTVPQKVGTYLTEETTGESTGREVFLQFSEISDFEVLEEAVMKVRDILNKRKP